MGELAGHRTEPTTEMGVILLQANSQGTEAEPKSSERARHGGLRGFCASVRVAMLLSHRCNNQALKDARRLVKWQVAAHAVTFHHSQCARRENG